MTSVLTDYVGVSVIAVFAQVSSSGLWKLFFRRQALRLEFRHLRQDWRMLDRVCFLARCLHTFRCLDATWLS